jgi:hypothetical protein
MVLFLFISSSRYAVCRPRVREQVSHALMYTRSQNPVACLYAYTHTVLLLLACERTPFLLLCTRHILSPFQSHPDIVHVDRHSNHDHSTGNGLRSEFDPVQLLLVARCKQPVLGRLRARAQREPDPMHHARMACHCKPLRRLPAHL